MKKIIPISIGVVLLAILAYVIFGSGNSTVKKVLNTEDGNKVGLQVEETKHLKEWIEEGTPVRCIIPLGETKAILLAKNGKIRIDGMPGTVNDGQVASAEKSTAIYDGEWSYIWSGTVGTKVNSSQLKKGATQTEEAQSSPYSWEDMTTKWENEKAGFTCSNQEVTDDQFAIPSGVEFTDMTSVLSAMPVVEGQVQE